MNQHTNLVRIRAVYHGLGPLRDQVVFVGGATVALYADRQAAEVRPTDDVDILVEIVTQGAFAAIEQQLRELGFKNDTSARFVGRYLLDGLIVDVMPTDEKILGFSNPWYKEGYIVSIPYVIDEQHVVRIFPVVYFMASKIAAFENRGNKDGRTSSDFEDVIYVLENRTSIWDELAAAPETVKAYLKERFNTYREAGNLEEWVSAHAGFGAYAAGPSIISGIVDFIESR